MTMLVILANVAINGKMGYIVKQGNLVSDAIFLICYFKRNFILTSKMKL